MSNKILLKPYFLKVLMNSDTILTSIVVGTLFPSFLYGKFVWYFLLISVSIWLLRSLVTLKNGNLQLVNDKIFLEGWYFVYSGKKFFWGGGAWPFSQYFNKRLIVDISRIKTIQIRNFLMLPTNPGMSFEFVDSDGKHVCIDHRIFRNEDFRNFLGAVTCQNKGVELDEFAKRLISRI